MSTLTNLGGTSRSSTSSGYTTHVCVYMAVDVSPSMRGSKIQEVCVQIQEIINTLPDNALFDITLFSSTAWKVVTALKTAIDISTIVTKMEAACNKEGGTALYDACGDMLMSIPESVLRHDEVKICVLTDGEDNCSTRYTLQSVQDLMGQKMSKRTTFSFLQAGKGQNSSVVQSFQKFFAINGTQGRVQSLVVDDNATGIRKALRSLNSDIMMSTRSSGRPSGAAIVGSSTTPHQSKIPSALTADSQRPTTSSKNQGIQLNEASTMKITSSDILKSLLVKTATAASSNTPTTSSKSSSITNCFKLG